MKVGSLFSGIGGFDLGLERAGYEIAWQVEIDPYCQRVLAKHWPHVTRYGDITAIDWATVPRVDLLCGGFPCQDLSFAGKRAGIDGARSGLWSEYVRAIVQLRPRYVLVENVPGLLSNPYMGRVLGDLAACGYDAEWDCLPASAVGAPHRRDRVWIVAYRNMQRMEERRVTIADASSSGRGCIDGSGSGSDGDGQSSSCENGDVADATELHSDGSEIHREHGKSEISELGNGGITTRTSDWWESEPDVGRVAARLSPKLDGGINGNEMDGEKTSTTGNTQPQEREMPNVCHEQDSGAASSELRGTEPSRDSVCELPYQGGSTGRHKENQAGEGLQDMRKDVSSEPHEEAQYMQPRVFNGNRAHQCFQEMASFWANEPADTPRVATGVKHRVDRLRGLGNAIVPQIAEALGRMILEVHHDSSHLVI